MFAKSTPAAAPSGQTADGQRADIGQHYPPSFRPSGSLPPPLGGLGGVSRRGQPQPRRRRPPRWLALTQRRKFLQCKNSSKRSQTFARSQCCASRFSLGGAWARGRYRRQWWRLSAFLSYIRAHALPRQKPRQRAGKSRFARHCSQFGRFVRLWVALATAAGGGGGAAAGRGGEPPPAPPRGGGGSPKGGRRGGNVGRCPSDVRPLLVRSGLLRVWTSRTLQKRQPKRPPRFTHRRFSIV